VGLLRDIRTLLDLAHRVEDVEEKCESLQLEWIDKKDAFELLLKRLATRDSRARRDDGDVAPAPPADSPGLPAKDSLRQLARSRGLIR